MLLTEYVDIVLQGVNIQHYENLGYEIPRSEVVYRDKNGRVNKKKWVVKRGTTIRVKIEDLQPNSNAFVDVLCDICKNQVSHMKYTTYMRTHTRGMDCCKKCAYEKNRLVFMEKYGVEWPSQIPGVQDKIRETNLQKYGYTSPFYVPEIRKKIKTTLIQRYGVENASQHKEFSDKAMKHRCQTMYQNGTVPTSSQQIAIYNMVAEHYGEDSVELNYPCDKCSLDVVLFWDNCNVDIEYDGQYWHLDAQRDMARDTFVKTQGYKILRIKSAENIPEPAQLYDAIDKIINSEHTYYEIVLPDWKTVQDYGKE